MTFPIIRAALCSWLHPGHVHWEAVGVQCFVDKIELSPVALLSFVFSSNCFWWNKKLEYKKPINKISILPSLTTAACLVYSLVLILWEGTHAVLSILNGSVELVCPSPGVYLELALALIQPVSHLDLVMPKSRFGFLFSLRNWWIVHMGTDLTAMATFVLSFLTDLSTDECLPSNYHRIYP